jgi:hypothetical protein
MNLKPIARRHTDIECIKNDTKERKKDYEFNVRRQRVEKEQMSKQTI